MPSGDTPRTGVDLRALTPDPPQGLLAWEGVQRRADRTRRVRIVATSLTALVVLAGTAVGMNAVFDGNSGYRVRHPVAYAPTMLPSVSSSGARPSSPSTGPSPYRSHRIKLALRPVSASSTCQQLHATTNLVDLLSAFRASRLRHLSVNGCITPNALSNYSRECPARWLLGSPGPFCLYGASSYRLTHITVIPRQAFQVHPNQYYVGLTDRLVPPHRTPRQHLYEYLTINRAPRTHELRITNVGH